MLAKLSIAFVASTVSRAALAASLFAVQPVAKFPSSVTDAGPNYPAPTTTFGRVISGSTAAPREVLVPSTVSESMPEMTGDQAHPTMGTGTTRSPRSGRSIEGPGSVSESMPEMGGGQSHPTMRR